jgi:hypothetical protein
MTTRAARALFAATLSLVPVLGLGGGAAFADDHDHATCTAIEIAATKAPEPAMAPDLKPLEKKLRKPPLSSWNSFKVLSSSELSLDSMKPASPKLAAGAVTVILRDVDSKEGKRSRLTLGIAMDGQTGKRVFDSKLTLDAGDYVVFGETLPNDDGHFVALTCKL